MELQALPSRIGQVRRIVSAQLRYWHLDPLIDRAALGVTELLSNVHRHARPDKSCTVELELLPDRLTVSVRDHDPRLPVPADVPDTADATPLATCGRGLAMVAAVSESWGARPDGENGKVVWFTLPAAAAPRSHPDHAPRGTTRPTPVPAGAGVGTGASVPTAGAESSVAAGNGASGRVAVGVANGAAVPARAAVRAGAVADSGSAGESGSAVPAGARAPGRGTAGTAPAGRTAPAPGHGAAPARTTVPAGSTVSAPTGRTAPAPAAGPVPVTAAPATPAPAARPASPAAGTPAPAGPAVRS
ncbi:Histidine kinase-, DNA gyrase B-, and HSP90-like ATPase [Streptomyces cyanogenus]|uniref:Histidine kinase-, DNA gyrase B-, and HSP90-like ATPase n=1 Tax=Streptomyces cyanogenus TaxID=80860 RepID=A0ABX7TJF0_STRCY|nr:Histidine kinase-, DNA gyrase B-, and HSP90-like ATPase [Streptomyces cyanogenus]